MRTTVLRFAGLCLQLVVLSAVAASTALAQSSISGLVSDGSGGALPGVTVEASSPALIEKVRTVVSDGQGRYEIINLRPGTYAIVFTLTGFNTFKRDEVAVLANTNVPINAALTLGAVEETITVSGQSPMVDITVAGKSEVISKALLDELPSSRTYATAGVILPGIKMTKPDIAGVSTVQHAYVLGRGMINANDNDYTIDGLSVKIPGGQPYTNFGMASEVAYQTSGGGAESSAGGIVVAMIPRAGGNEFHGDVFFGGSLGKWQATNIREDQIARGLPKSQFLDKFYDLNPSAGGPLKRDRVWFFGSWRRLILNNGTGGVYRTAQGDTPVGASALDDQWMHNGSLRLSGQINRGNQVTLYMDRNQKGRRHDMTDAMPVEVVPAFIDPGSAAAARNPRLYYVAYAKWTSVVTERLLIEAGGTMIANNYKIIGQPGYESPVGSPTYLTTVPRIDIITGTAFGGPVFAPQTVDHMYRGLSSNVTYASGSHTAKAGIRWRSGLSRFVVPDLNGSMIMRFRNGVADSVDVRNAPVNSQADLNANFDIYLQDTWKVGRFTVSPGIRFEYLKASLAPTEALAGRFVPARLFDGNIANLPTWSDVAPRFGAVYDLFGNAKTALKVTAGKYLAQVQNEVASRYNPMGLQTDRRNWFDCDFRSGTSTCSGIAMPTNGDGIAQNNEIGPSGNRNFGVYTGRRPAEDLRRQYFSEYTATVQHQLASAVSLSGGWYRRAFHNIEGQYNTLLDPKADYTPVQIQSPLSGETMTIFNLLPSKLGQVDIVDRNSSINRRVFTAYEVGFSLRLPRGANGLGGWSAERSVANTCDVNDPNQLRFCDQTGATYQELGTVEKIPYRHEFKLAVTYPLPFRANISMSLLSYAGAPLGVTWQPAASLFPNGQRTQAITAQLLSPGLKYLPRWNQLDVGAAKSFKVGSGTVGATMTLYNALNSSVELGQTQVFGPTLGRPSSVLNGRTLRLGLTAKF